VATLAAANFAFAFRAQLRAWWIRRKLKALFLASCPPAKSVARSSPRWQRRRARTPRAALPRAAPLVRDAAGSWRTGGLDLVLGGAFDLLQGVTGW